MRFQLVALALVAVAFSACSYSAQRAHKLKEDQKIAALVQTATVDDRVRRSGEGAYEATYLAVSQSEFRRLARVSILRQLPRLHLRGCKGRNFGR